MIKLLPLTIIVSILYNGLCFGQEIVFVNDSIFNVYKESGLSDKYFKPSGMLDKDSVKQGKWSEYRLKRIVVMINNNNLVQLARDNFLLLEEGNYIGNKREGVWVDYMLEEKTFKKIKYLEVSYNGGKRNGKCSIFYSDEVVAEDLNFREDTIVGLHKGYYHDGKLFCELRFSNQLKKDSSVADSKEFYRSGAIKSEVNTINGDYNGHLLKYYENGKLMESSYYKNGKKDSVYKYYYDNGQLWTEKHYKNGSLMEVAANFDEKGNPRERGMLANGTGTVILYNNQGIGYMVETYQNGKFISQDMKTTKYPFNNGMPESKILK